MVKSCVILVLFILCMGTVYAQPKSQCVIEDNAQGGVLECDVSFTTLLKISDGAIASNAWDPNDAAKDNLNNRFKQFAKIWCNTTAANSRIREISVFTDGYAKTDFWFFSEFNISGAHAGAFPFRNPSAFIYNAGGSTIAHEFAHSALTIYDEYREARHSILVTGSCRFPIQTHDTLNTLMGSPGRSRFSYSADYPRRGNIQTAQWACYGKSAWEVLIQSAYWEDLRPSLSASSYPRQDYFFQMSADIPDDAELMASERNITYSCDAPTINWISSTSTTNTVSTFSNTVAVMIDHSASMGDDQRLSVAQRAAKEAIDLLYAEETPVAVAIVGFDDVARTEIAPTPLDSTDNLSMIKSAIDALVADGGTDYGVALAHVQTVFAEADTVGQNVLIIVSDGETEQADLDYFRANKVSVYTVELDTKGKVVLQDAITEARNRLNMEVAAQRLTSFLPSVLRDTSLMRNNQLTTSVSFQSGSLDDVVTTPTFISAQSESASFILRWDEGAWFDSFTLQSPDGTMIDQADATRVSTDSIGYLEGVSQAIYTIGSPLSGEWQVHISGRGRFAYETAVSSGIIAGINAGPEIMLQEIPSDVVAYPEPIPVLVHVGGVAPITDADVVAEVTMPDERTMSLRLLDDGNAPDEVEGDGLYSGMMADYDQDGICEIKVTVSNLEGSAMYDSTKLINHIEPDRLGFNALAEPEAAPLFQRVVYDQVDVVNTREKSMPPPLSVMPKTITSIPYSHDGSIERVGQMDWYQFNAMSEGEHYYIQTSRLMGYDNTPMVTELSLYEPDGVSLIERNVRHRGSDASSIEWIAPRSGNYFISVAHAEDGRGYYELTVSDENLQSEYEMTEAERSSPRESEHKMTERQSRRGGFVGYPLLLLLLLAMIAWYRARADLQARRQGRR